MKTASFFLIAVLTSCILAPGVHSAEAPKPEPVASAAAADKDSTLYSEGTRAINEARWPDAAGLFNKVVQQQRPRAEGALYWKAYAENKEGQAARAINTCEAELPPHLSQE